MHDYYTSRPLTRALAVNAATAAFASRIPTITKPAGDGVVQIAAGGIVPGFVKIYPIGVGADNDAYALRVLGWRPVGGGPLALWVPSVLGEFTCTLSAMVGVTGSPVLATERFADTIAIVTEPTMTAATTREGVVELVSPVNDLAAHLVMPTHGCDLLEYQFDQTTGTPTMNVLYAYL